ncbi:DUF3043 domain-containing protein [Nakamurella antarctica]|uniref:DUF3043 domain-containing protein n=1 Tax=Nakamurella antarctica TaxID=1902245 RepID=A0A3G8ZVS5_9ACTN|nr:DUF3043 domain-containing protein [Nakamurella antarctica]AZI57771.1 DUF3043 domain-containing protein [Nakamurella antarctica]
MNFLNRKSPQKSAGTGAPDVAVDRTVPQDGEVNLRKGVPTPKQREKAPRRGPVAPPPRTQREAIKRSRSTPTTALTKEERKLAGRVRREAMMRGDDSAVLPRDRGPVRKYVRDLVDARRNLGGLLLPIALLSFLTLLVPSPVLQVYAPLVLMIFMLAAVADGIISGRQITRKVAAKFPKGDPTGMSTKGRSLGYYGFQRAMLIRRWRAPRPSKRPGDIVD